MGAGADNTRGFDWARATDAPGIRYRSPIDAPGELLADWLGICAPPFYDVSACAAGCLSVVQAARLVAHGLFDVVLTGGADSMVNPLGIGGMARLGAPSSRNAPDACRPFDAHRDGLVIGEGAACFVVEEEAHARARGAKVWGRVMGGASTQDAYRATAPLPEGLFAQRAMRRALRQARVKPADIDYISAHGTGTPLNDLAEARAIGAVFGSPRAAPGEGGTTRGGRVSPPVSSIKGAIGHGMAASGSLEILSCLWALMEGLMPGTCNLGAQDSDIHLDVIGPSPRPGRVRYALSNSFGFGGQNASIVLGRPEAGPTW